MLEINFFCKYFAFSASTYLASNCYLIFKVGAKLTYLVAIIGGPVTVWLPTMTKQNSIWSKALIMPLTRWNCVLSYKQKNFFSESQLVVPKKYFHNRIP